MIPEPTNNPAGRQEKSHRRYRGIIFDLDGTLLDTAKGVLESVLYTTKTMGYEPPREDMMKTFIGPPIKHSLIKVYGIDEEEANRATEIFRNRYKDYDLLKATPYDGLIEMQKTDVLDKCLKGLNLSPAEAVLIGDTASDGSGAKCSGTDFIAVTYGFGPSDPDGWKEFEPVFIAGKPADIGMFLGLAPEI